MVSQRERIRQILESISANIGRTIESRDENLAGLVDCVLEAPLSEDAEEARVDVCEVLLHLGVLTGDE